MRRISMAFSSSQTGIPMSRILFACLNIPGDFSTGSGDSFLRALQTGISDSLTLIFGYLGHWMNMVKGHPTMLFDPYVKDCRCHVQGICVLRLLDWFRCRMDLVEQFAASAWCIPARVSEVLIALSSGPSASSMKGMAESRRAELLQVCVHSHNPSPSYLLKL